MEFADNTNPLIEVSVIELVSFMTKLVLTIKLAVDVAFNWAVFNIVSSENTYEPPDWPIVEPVLYKFSTEPVPRITAAIPFTTPNTDRDTF